MNQLTFPGRENGAAAAQRTPAPRKGPRSAAGSRYPQNGRLRREFSQRIPRAKNVYTFVGKRPKNKKGLLESVDVHATKKGFGPAIVQY